MSDFVVPDCTVCGGTLKPEVVFFGELVPPAVFAAARDTIAAGQAVLVQAAPSHVAEVRRRVFDRLDADEVRQLATITGKLLAGLAEDDAGPVRSA